MCRRKAHSEDDQNQARSAAQAEGSRKPGDFNLIYSLFIIDYSLIGNETGRNFAPFAAFAYGTSRFSQSAAAGRSILPFG